MSLFGRSKPKTPETNEKVEPKGASENTIPEEVNVAISMSLYLYLNDRHDAESDVITIEQRQHNYSPWNSKIYGLNNILK